MGTAFHVVGIGVLLLCANWLIALIYLLPLTVMVETHFGPE